MRILPSVRMMPISRIATLTCADVPTGLWQSISDYVNQNPKVLGYHDLMVHNYGPGQRFASLHVEMDNREDPLLCHEIIDDMERECLQNHNVHLVIHYDPVATGDGHTNLIFDISLPMAMAGQEKRICTTMDQNLSAREGKWIYTFITFAPVSFN